MPRFYCPPPIPLSGSFELPPDAAHHASRVLRLRVGDTVEIFDGIGNECHGLIADLSARNVTVANITANHNKRESPLRHPARTGAFKQRKNGLGNPEIH